jgi:hypothetical protein
MQDSEFKMQTPSASGPSVNSATTFTLPQPAAVILHFAFCI